MPEIGGYFEKLGTSKVKHGVSNNAQELYKEIFSNIL
jgi:hypothetical protein